MTVAFRFGIKRNYLINDGSPPRAGIGEAEEVKRWESVWRSVAAIMRWS